MRADLHECKLVVWLKVADRPKWSGTNMAQALGHLQLEETSSAMEGLLSLCFVLLKVIHRCVFEVP